MKSPRCKTLVKNVLKKLGHRSKLLELGEIEIFDTMSERDLENINASLKDAGFEIVYDKKSRLIGRITAAIYQLVYLCDDQEKPVASEYISKIFNRDYTYLSNLFSETRGVTIQQYIIEQRIERVKGMIDFEGLNLSDIAFKLKYSSVAHLSNQFKKVTGITPTVFKEHLLTNGIYH